jgi:site-specific recombinase
MTRFDLIDQLKRADLSALHKLRITFDYIRPRNLQDSARLQERLNTLIYELGRNPQAKKELNAAFVHVLSRSTYVSLLSNTGINGHATFFGESWKHIGHTLLPPARNHQDLADVLAYVFHHRKDHLWLRHVRPSQWLELFDIALDTQGEALRAYIRQEMGHAVILLSHRITGIGLEPVLTSKMPEVDNLESPFLLQNKEAIFYFTHVYPNLTHADLAKGMLHGEVVEMLQRCQQLLNRLRQQKDTYGLTLDLLFLIRRLEQCVTRTERLIGLLHKAQPANAYLGFWELVLEIVPYVHPRNNLGRLFSENVAIFTNQIVEHSGCTGEKYITVTAAQYWQMFRSATIGGIIVAFLCVLKQGIKSLKTAPFVEALGFSLNYAAGFIAIHLFHGKLATKQPAMTASRIAAALESTLHGKTTEVPLPVLLARVARSQIASFLGNVALSFPMALLLGWAIYGVTGSHFLDTATAKYQLSSNNPLESLSILYASIAGVFLFLAGLVSGYFDNFVVYYKIPERLEQWRLLQYLSEGKRKRVVRYINYNLGALASNFFLGFCLGMAAFIGFILGIPFDIRHITFAAGNIGLAVAGLEWQLTGYEVLMAITGVFIIGVFNFLASFSLSFIVALSARRVSLRQTVGLLQGSLGYWLAHPLHFLFPPKKENLHPTKV